MEEEEDEICKIEHVGEVEDLEMSRSSDKRLRADEHDDDDGYESHSRGVGTSSHAKHAWSCGEDPLRVGIWLPR